MHHSRRTILTTDDIDSALKLRNVEVNFQKYVPNLKDFLDFVGWFLSDFWCYITQPIYGFASGDPLRFRRALGHKDLFYIDDKDVDFKDVRTVCLCP